MLVRVAEKRTFRCQIERYNAGPQERLYPAAMEAGIPANGLENERNELGLDPLTLNGWDSDPSYRAGQQLKFEKSRVGGKWIQPSYPPLMGTAIAMSSEDCRTSSECLIRYPTDLLLFSRFRYIGEVREQPSRRAEQSRRTVLCPARSTETVAARRTVI